MNPSKANVQKESGAGRKALQDMDERIAAKLRQEAGSSGKAQPAAKGTGSSVSLAPSSVRQMQDLESSIVSKSDLRRSQEEKVQKARLKMSSFKKASAGSAVGAYPVSSVPKAKGHKKQSALQNLDNRIASKLQREAGSMESSVVSKTTGGQVGVQRMEALEQDVISKMNAQNRGGGAVGAYAVSSVPSAARKVTSTSKGQKDSALQDLDDRIPSKLQREEGSVQSSAVSKSTGGAGDVHRMEALEQDVISKSKEQNRRGASASAVRHPPGVLSKPTHPSPTSSARMTMHALENSVTSKMEGGGAAVSAVRHPPGVLSKPAHNVDAQSAVSQMHDLESALASKSGASGGGRWTMEALERDVISKTNEHSQAAAAMDASVRHQLGALENSVASKPTTRSAQMTMQAFESSVASKMDETDTNCVQQTAMPIPKSIHQTPGAFSAMSVKPPVVCPHPPLVESDPEDPAQGLAVANLVNDDDLPADLPHAKPDHGKSLDRQGGSSKKKLLVLAGALLVAVVVVVLVIVFTKSESTTTMPLSPTQAPTSFGDVMRQRLEIMLPPHSLKEIQNNPQSPQAMAYQWSLEDPLLQDASTPDDRILQRYALATLYYSTGGASWYNSTHWLNHTIHECDWFTQATYGAAELGDTAEYAAGSQTPCYVYLGTRVYQRLWLHGNNLVGTIPPEFFLLSSLRGIQFRNNEGLIGSLPTQVGNMQKLLGLGLGNTKLTGTLPSQLGLLSSTITDFTVLGSNVHGTIPTQLGKLTKLMNLLLDSNQLTGSIPEELSNLTNLEALYLWWNQLTGTIPSWFSKMNQLLEFELDTNLLTGTIPTELGEIKETIWFTVNYNELSGDIPTELGRLTNTQHLWLGPNPKMSGSIPSELGMLGNLTEIHLFSTGVTGTIPTELGRATSLQWMHLFDNQLMGPVPSQIGQLSSLKELMLQSNMLSSSIPEELARASNLEVVQLADNKLSGTVVDEMGLLPNLTVFNITGNPLMIGAIPNSLCGLEAIVFDCSDELCGCECSCGIGNESSSNQTRQ